MSVRLLEGFLWTKKVTRCEASFNEILWNLISATFVRSIIIYFIVQILQIVFPVCIEPDQNL